jgi:hypothetical protein
MNITLDLLKKYNVQGPRYTSYPPAPSWNTSIGPAEYEAAIDAGHHEKNPVKLKIDKYLNSQMADHMNSTDEFPDENQDH